MKKTIIIGIDGLDYHLLNKWKEDLPNFRNLMENGSHGILKLTHTPTTVPAWPAMFTGKNEYQIGTVHHKRLNKNGEIEFPTPTWNKDAFWEEMGRKGLKSFLFRIPGTTKSKNKNNLVIKGVPYNVRGQKKGEEFGIRELPNNTSPKEKIRVSRKNLEEERGLLKQVFREDEYDFYFVVLEYPDRCLHRINKMESLKKAYKDVDGVLGELIPIIKEKGWNLIVTSDHGGRRYEEVFYLNLWLEERGLLNLKTGTKRNRLIFKIVDFIRRIGAGKIVNELYNFLKSKTNLNIEKQLPYEKIDWEKTQAFGFPPHCSDYGYVFINKNKEKVEQQIIENLPAPIREVKEKEEVYGEKADFLPDLILKGEDGTAISTRNGPKILEKRGHFKHASEGTFIALGSEFKEDYKMETQKIWNIAPLILFLYDLRIPNNLEGKVPKSLFKQDSDLSKKEVKFIEKKEIEGVEI